MKCGICGSPLQFKGISRKSRFSPTYYPCPRLQDPEAHPARHAAIVEAESKAAMYLGNANEHREAGRLDKAARDDERSQRWLDKANDLKGQGSR